MNVGAQGASDWPLTHYTTQPRFKGGLRLLALAAVVAVSYYLGSLLGLVLRVPPETTSVLWPPNAILTATLLLTPSPRRWWVYLAAAFPAHLAVQLGTGWPRAMILALYLTNCSEAVIAAWGLRRLDPTRVRFDTLRGMAFFLVAAVLVAPLLSSFPDAWIVSWQRGEPFWSVWCNRFFSNSLTELVFVPAIVMLLGGERPRCVGPARAPRPKASSSRSVGRRGRAGVRGPRPRAGAGGWRSRCLRPPPRAAALGRRALRPRGHELLAPGHGHHRALDGRARPRGGGRRAGATAARSRWAGGREHQRGHGDKQEREEDAFGQAPTRRPLPSEQARLFEKNRLRPDGPKALPAIHASGEERGDQDGRHGHPRRVSKRTRVVRPAQAPGRDDCFSS